MTDLPHFIIIGSGRVATHIGLGLVQNGWQCDAVYSRSLANADALANQLNTRGVNDICQLNNKMISTPPPLIILSIPDDALYTIVPQLTIHADTVVVHTSGSTPMDVLSPFPHHGVIYPLQTFSKDREIILENVPFYIESNDELSSQTIKELTQNLGLKSVTECTSDQRVYIHLAAVFCCNFLNHMLFNSYKIMEGAGLNPQMLSPLIEETISKALSSSPRIAQTGPAMRGDQRTIKKHLKMLDDQPEMKELYLILSESIYKHYNHEQNK